MNVFDFSTLRVRWRTGRTMALALLILLLLFIIFEGVLRLNFVHQRLAPSRMGSRHSQLGVKLRLMEVVITAEGELDCVVLGSSVVDNGLDPRAFAGAYKEVTGESITCFNFGIDAIPGATAGILAEILVRDYRPGILIYGFDGRDLAVARDDQDTTVVLDSPWVQYRAGRFNIEGWLYEYSYVKRYAKQLKHILVFDYENALWKPSEELTALGYNALHEVSTAAQLPPQADDDSFQVRYLTDLLADFQVPRVNVQGLEQLLQLDSERTQVFVVAMPVADGYYSFYDNGRAEYESFVNEIREIVMRAGVPFLRPDPNRLVPADGWYDYMHVNVTGAEAFSAWLAVQVGTAPERDN